MLYFCTKLNKSGNRKLLLIDLSNKTLNYGYSIAICNKYQYITISSDDYNKLILAFTNNGFTRI